MKKILRNITIMGLSILLSTEIANASRTNYFMGNRVVEKSSNPEDTYLQLLKGRIVFIEAPIDDIIANRIVSQLLLLEAEDPKRDITLYINSPGGSVTAGMAIYDMMQYIKNDVRTICIGQCASMAALLLSAGTKGKRFSMPNARILIHSPSVGAQNQKTDIRIQAEEVIRIRELASRILAKHTGKSYEQVEKDTETDRIMSGLQAKEYGIVDSIIEYQKK